MSVPTYNVYHHWDLCKGLEVVINCFVFVCVHAIDSIASICVEGSQDHHPVGQGYLDVCARQVLISSSAHQLISSSSAHHLS